MHITTVLVSSAVVAAIVAGLISFFTQRWLLERKAQIDYELPAIDFSDRSPPRS